jgi:hypothetical protein
MSRAYLRDWMATPDDDDRLATLDRIQQIREVPGCLSRGHGFHVPILSDNQIPSQRDPEWPGRSSHQRPLRTGAQQIEMMKVINWGVQHPY